MTTFSEDRIKQVIIASTIILLASAINLITSKLYLISFIQIILSSIFLYALILIRKNKIPLAISIFSYSSSIALGIIIWQGGLGLHNAAIGIFTLLAITIALIGSALDIIIVILILTMTITLIGEETIQNWHYFSAFEMSFQNMIDSLLVLFLSGFIILIFSLDFKKTLAKLSIENKRLHESKENIYHLAHYDHLTGLRNRIAAKEQYHHKLATTDFNESLMILFFIDLDNFKEINDLISHHAGDNILIEVANRLNLLTEPNDVSCRLGGDEFLLIVIKPSTFSTEALAQELLRSITQPYQTHETTLEVTTSIGITIITESGVDFDEACKKSDMAMYKAKQRGKNNYHYYDNALREQNIRKSAIISGLKRAVKDNLLELYFQPKVDLTTEKIIGAEALLRWTRENSYQSSPMEFIPLIESSEIIVEIGEWVIRQACLHCKQWHNAGYSHMQIAVNISAIQLLRGNFRHIITSALEDAKLDPSFLEIELTEYLLLNKTEHISAQLASIKDMGIKLAIDDFGTGYSNPSYLTKFKVDTLKLDKSFIQQINSSPKNLSIVTAIISMAHIINVSIIAEGIESTQERDILRKLNCPFGQGYLWGKPLPEKPFMALLNRENTQLCTDEKKPGIAALEACDSSHVPSGITDEKKARLQCPAAGPEYSV